MRTHEHIKTAWGLVLLVGCNVAPGDETVVSGGVTDTAPAQDTDGTDSDDDGDDAATDEGDDGGFPDDGDGPNDSGDPIDPAAVCEVPDGELDAPGPCLEDEPVPATTIEPVVQWSLDLLDCHNYDDSSGGDVIVANLTDDNDDGVVDQCDVPDVAFTCHHSGGTHGVSLYVLDGATGEIQLKHTKENKATRQGGTYHYYPTVAAADVDGDGAAELVWAHYTQITGENQQESQTFVDVEAVRGDGTVLWTSTVEDSYAYYGMGISTADLDGDGEPTLLVGHHALNGQGVQQWQAATVNDHWYGGTAPVATDLDDDGFLEVIWGRRVFEHDGSLRFEIPAIAGSAPHQWGWDVALADLDEDGTPELLVDVRGDDYADAYGEHYIHIVSANGDLVGSVHIDHDDDWYDYYGWEGWSHTGAMAIADIDGDGDVEAVIATGRLGVSVVDFVDGALTEVADFDHPAVNPEQHADQWYYGHGAITVFDLLGTGESQIIRTGLGTVAVFDAAGGLLFDGGVSDLGYNDDYRWGNDALAIADIDNDGSAEIVAKTGYAEHSGGLEEPRLIVYEDPNNGWAGARRIWNQTAYHVSHIREDGGIPSSASPGWQTHNTFRVQSSQQPSQCGGSTTPEG